MGIMQNSLLLMLTKKLLNFIEKMKTASNKCKVNMANKRSTEASTTTGLTIFLCYVQCLAIACLRFRNPRRNWERIGVRDKAHAAQSESSTD